MLFAYNQRAQHNLRACFLWQMSVHVVLEATSSQWARSTSGYVELRAAQHDLALRHRPSLRNRHIPPSQATRVEYLRPSRQRIFRDWRYSRTNPSCQQSQTYRSTFQMSFLQTGSAQYTDPFIFDGGTARYSARGSARGNGDTEK